MTPVRELVAEAREWCARSDRFRDRYPTDLIRRLADALAEREGELELVRREIGGKPCQDTDGERYLRWDCLANTPYGGPSNPTVEHYQHTSACRLNAALNATRKETGR